MASLVSQKYRLHTATQFKESLAEGLRTYGNITANVVAGNTTVVFSANVFSGMRTGDLLVLNNETQKIVDIASSGLTATVDVAFSTSYTNTLFKTREPILLNDAYYVFIGRPTSWNDEDSPDAPVDSIGSMEYDYLSDTVAIQRITVDDVSYVVPRHDWIYGSVYNMYDHRADIAELSGNVSHPFYVLTSDKSVFKCMYNGRTETSVRLHLNVGSDAGSYTTGERVYQGESLANAVAIGTVAHWSANQTSAILTVIPDSVKGYFTASASNVHIVGAGAVYTLNSMGVVWPYIPASLAEPNRADYDTLDAIVGYASSDERHPYEWKYLYTLSESEQEKYLTSTYMPVRDAADTINPATGDVYNDNSTAYKAFDVARLFGNGAIHTVLVEYGGTGYDTAPIVDITGDGTDGATAVSELTSGTVTAVRIKNPGQDYTRANVTFVDANCTSKAVATAIIAPKNAFTNSTGTFYRSNHSISNKNELFAKQLMLSVELATDAQSQAFPVSSDAEVFNYRRIGIIKNPLLANSGTVASNALYSTCVTLLLSGASGMFPMDSQVTQNITGATGTVVDYTQKTLRLTNVSGTFISGENSGINSTSTGTALVETVTPSPILPYTGEILYVNHRAPVVRTASQTEIIRTILTF